MNATQKVDQRKSHNPNEYWKVKSQELKNAGYTLKVRHDRVFARSIIVQQLNRRVHAGGNKEAPLVVIKKVDDIQIMTKGEMYKQDPAIAKAYSIRNHDGCTSISIYKDDKLVATGRARVSHQDQFVKSWGLVRALNKAVTMLEESKTENNN